MNQQVREQLKVPALALKIVAVLYVLMAAIGTVMVLLEVEFPGAPSIPRQEELIWQFVADAIQVGLAVLLWLGATRMGQVRGWGLCLAAAIAALLPCSCCCIIGMPFGIWALIVLSKPEVKAAFSPHGDAAEHVA